MSISMVFKTIHNRIRKFTSKSSSKEDLTSEEVRYGLDILLKEGMTSQALVTMTSGVFLVAFALKLGASNLSIGLLAAIPPLMQLLQIPAILLVEKVQNRRLISASTSFIGRTFWLFVALSALVFGPKDALCFLIIALMIIASFAAVSVCSWNSWMRDLVPQDQMGEFFSRRIRRATVVGLVLSLSAAVYIDIIKKKLPDYEIYAYASLFFIGFLSGMLGVYFITNIPEPKMTVQKRHIPLSKLLMKPFGDLNFKRLILFLGPWNFAVNLAAPFFTVYMLKRLELGLSVVIALTVLSQVLYIGFLRIWGRFSDRFSNKSVLSVCGPLFMACVLGWTFTTMPEKYAATYPLLVILHVLMGIATAGVTLASGNIALKLAPKEEGTPYLAASSLVISIAASIGPVLGGNFADFFASRELAMTLTWKSPLKELSFNTFNLQHWDFFFLLAFLIGIYSLYRLAKVHESGEVEESIVIHELISEISNPIRNFSTVGGLRKIIYFPFAHLKHFKGSLNNKKKEI
jgi:MFS family permease